MEDEGIATKDVEVEAAYGGVEESVSPTLLGIVALIYVYVAWSYWQNRQTGMALAFFAYAIANIGFMIDIMRRVND